MTFFRKADVVAHDAHAFPGGIGEGALVRTPDGPRPVERLRPGDRVATRDGGLQPVLAIWCREVSGTLMQADPGLAPVCIEAQAFGVALPLERLRIAPDHKVLLPGYLLDGAQGCVSCLVEIGDLASGAGPVSPEAARRPLRFYTIVFATHQVFCANGLAVESFHVSPCSQRQIAPCLAEEVQRLFPDMDSAPESCARVGYKLVSNARLSPGTP